MANIAEIKASLGHVATEASTSAAALRATAGDVERSIHKLRATFGSSGHPRAVQGLAHAEQYRLRLVEAAELAEQGAAAVRAYTAALG